MAANYFKYNKTKFTDTIAAYETAIEAFKKLQKDTKESIETLKNSGWDSEAGKEFFKNYTDDWSPILDDYVDLLEFLKKCLAEGQTQFDPLITEAKSLKIQ